jgi:hypothetical protein
VRRYTRVFWQNAEYTPKTIDNGEINRNMFGANMLISKSAICLNIVRTKKKIIREYIHRFGINNMQKISTGIQKNNNKENFSMEYLCISPIVGNILNHDE